MSQEPPRRRADDRQPGDTQQQCGQALQPASQQQHHHRGQRGGERQPGQPALAAGDRGQRPGRVTCPARRPSAQHRRTVGLVRHVRPPARVRPRTVPGYTARAGPAGRSPGRLSGGDSRGVRVCRGSGEQVGDDVPAVSLSSVRAMYQGAQRCRSRRTWRRGPGVVIPAAIGLQVHAGELPDLPRVVHPALQPPGLLAGADLQPVLHKQDPLVGHGFLDPGRQLEEPVGLPGGAEAHHRFDAGRLCQLRSKITTSPAAGKWGR